MKPGETGASSGEEPSAEAPAAGLAAEFAPTPWQGRWEVPGSVQAGTCCGSLGLGWRSTPGTFEGRVPSPDHIARVTVCHPRGKSSQTR